MSGQSSFHYYLNWAKERIDEMDAALASLENKASEVQADLRTKSTQALAELRKKRDEFQDAARKQAEANDAAWASIKAQLDSDWTQFESELDKYVATFGEQVKQQQATFKLQAEAQIKAWRDAADKLNAAATEFAGERRGDIDTMVGRMKADATQADERLQKLSQAGTASWSAMMNALNETRAAFDRANQSARDAFRKAAS